MSIHMNALSPRQGDLVHGIYKEQLLAGAFPELCSGTRLCHRAQQQCRNNNRNNWPLPSLIPTPFLQCPHPWPWHLTDGCQALVFSLGVIPQCSSHPQTTQSHLSLSEVRGFHACDLLLCSVPVLGQQPRGKNTTARLPCTAYGTDKKGDNQNKQFFSKHRCNC